MQVAQLQLMHMGPLYYSYTVHDSFSFLRLKGQCSVHSSETDSFRHFTDLPQNEARDEVHGICAFYDH